MTKINKCFIFKTSAEGIQSILIVAGKRRNSCNTFSATSVMSTISQSNSYKISEHTVAVLGELSIEIS
jgi:hypothetical protein